jgi:hypothetical protein
MSDSRTRTLICYATRNKTINKIENINLSKISDEMKTIDESFDKTFNITDSIIYAALYFETDKL